MFLKSKFYSACSWITTSLWSTVHPRPTHFVTILCMLHRKPSHIATSMNISKPPIHQWHHRFIHRGSREPFSCHLHRGLKITSVHIPHIQNRNTPAVRLQDNFDTSACIPNSNCFVPRPRDNFQPIGRECNGQNIMIMASQWREHLDTGACIPNSNRLVWRPRDTFWSILLIRPGVGNTGDCIRDFGDWGRSESLRGCLGLLYSITCHDWCRFLHYPDRKAASTRISLLIN